jgi:hypothetical protein
VGRKSTRQFYNRRSNAAIKFRYVARRNPDPVKGRNFEEEGIPAESGILEEKLQSPKFKSWQCP